MAALDQELVERLHHHVAGRTLPSFGAINEEIDAYSSRPDQLPNVSRNGSYYYADRNARSRRTLDGSGYWKAKDKKPILKDGQIVIGYKRNFRFYLGPSHSNSNSTKWVMTEYTLPPDTSHGKALCVIRVTAGNQENEIDQASTSDATNQPLPNYPNFPDILMRLAADLGVDYELPPLEFNGMDRPPF
ncbi:uncharacterized protein LOC113461103 [Phoenix dactylifera]|uniref:Uncharacterized protein LOC113461103 n=1 Tax=Phoenix dactylifera TaxID=42345 RepID=A0A8B9ANU8_PHODC|nr:uncharacterized protein LOC113461103 [Phoenix dactylifera]